MVAKHGLLNECRLTVESIEEEHTWGLARSHSPQLWSSSVAQLEVLELAGRVWLALWIESKYFDASPTRFGASNYIPPLGRAPYRHQLQHHSAAAIHSSPLGSLPRSTVKDLNETPPH